MNKLKLKLKKNLVITNKRTVIIIEMRWEFINKYGNNSYLKKWEINKKLN